MYNKKKKESCETLLTVPLINNMQLHMLLHPNLWKEEG